MCVCVCMEGLGGMNSALSAARRSAVNGFSGVCNSATWSHHSRSGIPELTPWIAHHHARTGAA